MPFGKRWLLVNRIIVPRATYSPSIKRFRWKKARRCCLTRTVCGSLGTAAGQYLIEMETLWHLDRWGLANLRSRRRPNRAVPLIAVTQAFQTDVAKQEKEKEARLTGS